MPRKRVEGICSVENCQNPIKSFGWCNKHYQQFYKEHPNYKARTEYTDKRRHPLYVTWWQRKQDETLCDVWLDFDKFINDVKERPSKDHFLIRKVEGLFGPDNFKWEEHLRKRDDESFREWWSRKRTKRIALNPTLESDRNIKRKYGLSREQYNEKLQNQNHCCIICGEKETSVDGRTNKFKLLAVDHNHKTNKIRDLLCWRCNTVIGRINEDLDLLDKIKAYLVKHL